MAAKPYLITHADSSVAGFTIAPGSLDGYGQPNHNTDLFLPGANRLEYGADYNINFVRLLENFCHPQVVDGIPSPTVIGAPTEGQLWFNSTTKRMHVYNGSVWTLLASGGGMTTDPMDPGATGPTIEELDARYDARYLKLTGGQLSGPLDTTTLTGNTLTVNNLGSLVFSGDGPSSTGAIYRQSTGMDHHYRFAIGNTTTTYLSIGKQSDIVNPGTYTESIRLHSNGNITTLGAVSADGGLTVGTSVNVSGVRINNVGSPVIGTDAATKTYVDAAVAGVQSGSGGGLSQATADTLYVNVTGDTMTGPLSMNSNKITSLGAPTVGSDAATKTYVDGLVAASGGLSQTQADARYLQLAGGTMAGILNMNNRSITNLPAPTATTHATNKTYVDSAVASVSSQLSTFMAVAGTNTWAGRGYRITSVAEPTVNTDAATKNYVDTRDAIVAATPKQFIMNASPASSILSASGTNHPNINRWITFTSPTTGGAAFLSISATRDSETSVVLYARRNASSAQFPCYGIYVSNATISSRAMATVPLSSTNTFDLYIEPAPADGSSGAFSIEVQLVGTM